nr:hypothetical protein [Tanacetum cinerariifolium]
MEIKASIAGAGATLSALKKRALNNDGSGIQDFRQEILLNGLHSSASTSTTTSSTSTIARYIRLLDWSSFVCEIIVVDPPPHEHKRLLKWPHSTARIAAPSERKRWSLKEEVTKPFEIAMKRVQREIKQNALKLSYPGDSYPDLTQEHRIYIYKGEPGLYQCQNPLCIWAKLINFLASSQLDEGPKYVGEAHSTSDNTAPDEHKRLLKWPHSTARIAAPSERKRWSLKEEVTKPFEIAMKRVQREIKQNALKLSYPEDSYPDLTQEHRIYIYKGEPGLYQHSFLHTSSKPLQLNHILVTPHIIKNLIPVRKFTSDNDVSVEFDAYGFSQPSSQTPVVLLSFSSTTWHRRLGHPGDDVLRRLESKKLISCRKSNLSPLCHACQLEPRSTPCIFLGYPTNHRGYRCLDISSNKIIISRHVRFDEDVFRLEMLPLLINQNDFLLPPIQTTTNVPTTELFVQHIDEPNNLITAHPTTPLTSPPQPDSLLSHSSTPIQPQPDTHPSHSSTPIPTLAQTQSHAQTVDSHTSVPINNSSQTMPTHPMVTRAKARIFKQLKCMNCHVTTTSPLPRSHVHALRDPNWKEAMLGEYNALITNATWVLVPRPANVNMVRSMWLFKHKFNAYGSLSRYKARLVANERSQQQSIDCDETFSPVIQPTTIRTVLSLAVSCDWPIHQLDVNNAFLHGYLSETVYMHQHPGFVDPNKPNYVCHLQRSLYELKQASRSDIAYLLLYVDDIILIPSSSAFLQRIIASLHKEILERAHMQNCKPCRTLVDTESKLGSDGDSVSDPTLYRSLAGTLQYLTFTRPDLSYVVQQLHVSSTTQLSAYTDADWAGCPVTRRSTSGYCVFLGDNLLSWSAKRQVTLSRSSAEAEYRGISNVVAETAWIRNLLCELHTLLFTATLVYCDNDSAVYMSANPVQHQRMKHIEIHIHFIRDFVASGQVRVLHVPLRFQKWIAKSIHKMLKDGIDTWAPKLHVERVIIDYPSLDEEMPVDLF